MAAKQEGSRYNQVNVSLGNLCPLLISYIHVSLQMIRTMEAIGITVDTIKALIHFPGEHPKMSSNIQHLMICQSSGLRKKREHPSVCRKLHKYCLATQAISRSKQHQDNIHTSCCVHR